MEDEAEKVVALKKVYAEIILNTTKEAAARVMASERRALGYRQELASTKDEALRMSLRLKHMIDAKTAEAEMASLNQQRKIEELEAQLNEAEDVITDLRAELKQVWLELEKTKISQVQPLDGQNIKQVASFESVRPDALVSSNNQELERVTNCDEINKPSPKQPEQLCISNLEDYYVHDSEFASIIMRSKEPELCKNGWTQRIRAFEGNLLDEKVLPQDVHSQHFGIKNGLIVKDSDAQVVKFSRPSARTRKREIKKHAKCYEKPKRKIFPSCRSCFHSCKSHINENGKSDKAVCSLTSIKPCAIGKWKRKKKRCRPSRKESSVFECSKPSFVLKQCSSVCGNGKCCQDKSHVTVKAVPHLTDVEPVHGSTGVTESVQAVNKFDHVEKAMEQDNGLLNSNILEGNTSRNLKVPGSNMKVEVVDIPSLNSDLEDAKAFGENDGSIGQVDSSRLLKYTFQRKRKKESSLNPDEEIDSEKSTVKRRVEEKKSGAVEPHKSSMMDEPSRDSRRQAQVARQLISLSAKRW